jgi:glycosyltransferase involved in cell wall biosynthesis
VRIDLDHKRSKGKAALLETKPLNIMVVSAEALSEGFAAHSHVRGMSDGLQKRGHRITVIGRATGSYFTSSIPARFLRYISVNFDAISAMKRHDVLVARAHFANYFWVKVAGWRGIPVVQEMNGLLRDAATTHPWLRGVQMPIAWSYRQQLLTADAVACVTEEIAEQVQKLRTDAQIAVITNGVDSTQFFPDAHASATSDYAIFCSALTPWHGIDTLLQAVEHVEWPRGLRLLIAGDGNEADRVREAAGRNNLITYIGLQRRDGLAKLIRSAALGLSPLETLAQRGINEVSPLKVYEMMASGIAIVATDLAGQRELVLENACGVIVPPSDPVALARAVRDLYLNPDRTEMGQRGAAAIALRHDWFHRAGSLVELMEKVLHRKALQVSDGT